MFVRFWRRELDIEDPQAIEATLRACDIDADAFPAFADNKGRQLHDANQRDAEERGVFGVPSYLVSGELFWGAERLEGVREAVRVQRTPPKRRRV